MRAILYEKMCLKSKAEKYFHAKTGFSELLVAFSSCMLHQLVREACSQTGTCRKR